MIFATDDKYVGCLDELARLRLESIESDIHESARNNPVIPKSFKHAGRVDGAWTKGNPWGIRHEFSDGLALG